MKNIFSIQRIKLVLVIVGSFMAVKFLSPQVFLADSPKINPVFISKLINAPSYIASLPGVIGQLWSVRQKTGNNVDEIAAKKVPPNLIFNSLTKGVEAANDEKNNKVYLKMQPGTSYSVEEIEINGVKKKILRIYKE